jgi:Flp pilus assembly protein TadD
MRPIHSFISRTLGIALLMLAPFLPVLKAAEAQDEHPKELSDQVTTELANLKGLVEAKNYKGIIHLLDTLIPTAGPESYDLAVLSQIKSQVLLTDSQYEAALAPMEKSLSLGDKYGYFDQATVLSSLYTLVQVYYQQAADLKDIPRQKELYEKSCAYFERWLKESPKITAENELFYASIRYNEATLDAAHPDLEKVRLALAAVEKSLTLSVKVNTQAYVLMLAAQQQLGDNQKTAELFEVLVQREPGNATYWQQLLATYYALAGAAKKDADLRRYNLRSLITYERAQAHGQLTTPRDNFSIVALYFSLQQFNRAATFLSKGLKDGSIESSRRNWELLAAAYQQQHEEESAADALLQATKLFPTEGQLEFNYAQLRYSQEKTAEAYAHLETAIAKGNLDKPGPAFVFIAFVAFELKRFEDAARWADAATDKPDVKKDDLARLKRAIKEAIREREALKTSSI